MQRAIAFLFLALLANTAYVAAFATPSIFYMANVLLHVGLGFALLIAGRRYLPSFGATLSLGSLGSLGSFGSFASSLSRTPMSRLRIQ